MRKTRTDTRAWSAEWCERARDAITCHSTRTQGVNSKMRSVSAPSVSAVSAWARGSLGKTTGSCSVFLFVPGSILGGARNFSYFFADVFF